MGSKPDYAAQALENMKPLFEMIEKNTQKTSDLLNKIDRTNEIMIKLTKQLTILTYGLLFFNIYLNNHDRNNNLCIVLDLHLDSCHI